MERAFIVDTARKRNAQLTRLTHSHSFLSVHNVLFSSCPMMPALIVLKYSLKDLAELSTLICVWFPTSAMKSINCHPASALLEQYRTGLLWGSSSTSTQRS